MLVIFGERLMLALNAAEDNPDFCDEKEFLVLWFGEVGGVDERNPVKFARKDSTSSRGLVPRRTISSDMYGGLENEHTDEPEDDW